MGRTVNCVLFDLIIRTKIDGDGSIMKRERSKFAIASLWCMYFILPNMGRISSKTMATVTGWAIFSLDGVVRDDGKQSAVTRVLPSKPILFCEDFGKHPCTSIAK